MKKFCLLMIVALVGIGTVTVSCDAKSTPSLKNGVDSASYAIGILQGQGFKENIKTIPGGCNVDQLIIGFLQVLKDDTANIKMDPMAAQMFVQSYFTKVAEQEAAQVKEEGIKFLEENKKKDGIQVTASGLQYKVITEGTGPKPVATDRVKVDYVGTLIDGTEFDSSKKHGEAAVFGVDQVIPGWTEGLQLMPVGSKYMFYIPGELAYGERGSRNIKPNSVLVFEVDLLEILPETK